MKTSLLLTLIVGATVLSAAQTPPAGRGVALGDWPEARGPSRDGVSKETGLVEKWAINGENFLWRVPYGGRSAPIVMGNRVYVQNPSGRGPTLQERVMALDADTGKVVWEYKFNIFQSDVPPHRVGWASPAADPDTGNIYALGVGATVIALNKDGKLLWDRSIGEEFAAFTTHGGRTMSPLIDGDLVIVSAPISSWGTQANRLHRFVALDKRTGDIVWVASPGGRPYDTAYAAPLIATINGMRLLICGTGDGAVHAIKPQTGEKVWTFVAAKRAVNTGVVVSGTTVIVSHGDENLDSNELGMIAAIDGSQTGDIKTTRWAMKGDQFGFSSPVIDGARVYQIENGSRLKAFDLETGRDLLTRLGADPSRSSPLDTTADGLPAIGTAVADTRRLGRPAPRLFPPCVKSLDMYCSHRCSGWRGLRRPCWPGSSGPDHQDRFPRRGGTCNSSPNRSPWRRSQLPACRFRLGGQEELTTEPAGPIGGLHCFRNSPGDPT